MKFHTMGYKIIAKGRRQTCSYCDKTIPYGEKFFMVENRLVHGKDFCTCQECTKLLKEELSFIV